MHPILLNASVDDVVTLKLSYGEEIIGKFKSTQTTSGASFVELHDVQTVVPQMLSAQEVGIQLIPWVFSDTDPVVLIDSRFIVTAFTINNDTSARYLEHTSKIIL
jgi:hypothetical protein